MNYSALQRRAHNLIVRFGGGTTGNGALRRNGQDRPCTVVILQFSQKELQDGLIVRTDKKVLISGVDLSEPPDFQQDSIVLGGVEHRMVLPAVPLSPDGSTVLYWEVVARK